MSEQQNTHKSEPMNPERRNFLALSLKVLAGLAALELTGAGVLFLRARSLEGKFGGIITAGKLEDFKAGSVVEFDDENFYLLCFEDNGFMALYRRCTHLGCTVNWMPVKEKFYCPCHAASFDHNGESEATVAPRALDTFRVYLEDGLVKVDTSQVQMREHHLAEHISYLKSDE